MSESNNHIYTVSDNFGLSGEQYSALAPYYERLNSAVDYDEWTDFLVGTISEYSLKKPEIILDLACGTGAITRRLAKSGFDMIGIDISEDMLAEAARMEYQNENDVERKAATRGHHTTTNPLYLCQDIRCFELYGTVGAAVCCLDGLNYLTGHGDLDRCFGTLYNYLEPGGLFIFDVNSPHKFENIFSSCDYILEAEHVFCAWQNNYNKKTKICDFHLSLFTEDTDGKWIRSEEVQRERCYSSTAIKRSLGRKGFEILKVFGDFGKTPASETDERWFFVAKRV